jgi:hypothetical protein
MIADATQVGCMGGSPECLRRQSDSVVFPATIAAVTVADIQTLRYPRPGNRLSRPFSVIFRRGDDGGKTKAASRLQSFLRDSGSLTDVRSRRSIAGLLSVVLVGLWRLAHRAT